MATTNIDVNKQNVVDLLKSGKDHPLLSQNINDLTHGQMTK